MAGYASGRVTKRYMMKKNRKYREMFRGFLLVCLMVSVCGCGKREKKIKTAEANTEVVGPVFDKEAAEKAEKSRLTVTPTLESIATPTPTVISTPTATPTPTVTPAPTVTPTPELTATPTPTPTKIPDKTALEDQASIKKPDHPAAIAHDKLIFIGDSRTEGIRDAVQDGSIWSCLSSMGYNWMVSTGVPQIEGEIGSNTAVIILMGVNDVYNINNYISYINAKANEWAALGATTYFVSVGPGQNDPYVSNAEIENFNAAMQANLVGVYYIDMYSYLVSKGFSTLDGTHYPDSVSIDIYNYILDNLQEQRSGIWG